MPSGFASLIHRIAVVTIGIGLGAMIVAYLVLHGFRNRVEEKIYSFSGHLLVNRISGSNAVEEAPFETTFSLVQHPDSFPMVDRVQEFSHKAGLIKTEDEILGIVLKGVGPSFDLDRFKENMKVGRFIRFSDSTYAQEIVVSQWIADKLRLSLGDDVTLHFFQYPPRARRVTVVGIYESNLSDYFDEKIILADIGMIRRLNGWNEQEAGGLQIYLKDVNRTQDAYMDMLDRVPFDLYVEQTRDRYVQVFEWLDLISRQVNILLGVILLVVCVNMVSVVLILVMERTNMIGVLKALGADNGLIRRVFYAQGARLIFRGLLLGNAIGLGVCWLQHQFGLIRLNPRNYYMDTVPVAWAWDAVIGLNLLVFVVVFVVLMLPAMFISRVTPVEAIRFD